MAIGFWILIGFLMVIAVALAARADAALAVRRVAASNISRLDRQESQR